MINRILMTVNNGRSMELAQQGKDENITLTTYTTASGLVDCEMEISAGDMVMLINYYRFQKENDLEIF